MRNLERTQDFLDVLICGLPSKARINRLLLMLAAYFDDSGRDGNGPVFVLAGWAASAEKWRSFSNAWQAVLDLEEPRRLSYFKMAEANSRREQFWGWSEEERDQCVSRLIAVIKEHVSFGIHSLLWWDDYREVRAQYPRFSLEPYEIMFASLMIGAAYRAHTARERIEFIFDDQGLLGNNAAYAFDIARQHLLPSEAADVIAGYPIHRSDKEFLPIQAADLYAWHLRSVCDKSVTAGTLQDSGVLSQFRGVPSTFQILNKDELTDWAKRFEAANPTGWTD